jgi:hypothetical protein
MTDQEMIRRLRLVNKDQARQIDILSNSLQEANRREAKLHEELRILRVLGEDLEQRLASVSEIDALAQVLRDPDPVGYDW